MKLNPITTFVIVFLVASSLVAAASPDFLRNDISNLLTISGVSAPADCPDGQVVMNTTTAGVECVTPSGAGDITGVTAGTGLSGGGASGSVTLNIDNTFIQMFNDSGSAGDNASWNKTHADTLYSPISLVALHTADNTSIWAVLTSNLAKILTTNTTLNTVSTKLDNTNTTDNIENLGFNITTDLTFLYDSRYLDTLLNLYFYNDSDSFNNSYTVMNITLPSGTAQINTFAGLGAGDTLLGNRILSTLQLSLLQTGAYTQHTTVNYTAGSRDVQLKSTLHKRLVNGTEEEIGSSPLSSVLTPSAYQQVIWTGTVNTETQFSAGDYLVMKLFATVSGGGGAPTISVVVAGDTAARLDVGIDPIDIRISEADPYWTNNESRVAQNEIDIDTLNATKIDSGSNASLDNLTLITDVCLDGGSCLSEAGVGGGDITAVNTNGQYLTGGAASGAVSILLNETVLNATCTALDTNTNETIRLTALEGLHAADNTSIWTVLNSNLAKILTTNTTLNTVSTKLDNTNKTENIEELGFTQGAHTTDTNETTRIVALETIVTNINVTENIEELGFTQGAHTTNVDTNLTEDNVEAYIFDNDNAATFNLTGYNLSVSYILFDNGGLIYDNATHTIIE